MRILFNKFDKKALAELPMASFDKKIVVVNNEFDAERAVDFLLKQDILGLDTETRPTFHRGESRQVSLLQVGTEEICFLFRLNHIGMPDSIVRLLSDQKTIKVGLSLKNDIDALLKRRQFTPGQFVDLQKCVKDFGIEDMSLQKIFANIFQQKISKKQQLSNWEADILSDKQKLYAATDAWACVMIYNELNKLKEEGYELKIVEPVTAPLQEGEINLPPEEKKSPSRGKKKSRRRKNTKTTKKQQDNVQL